MRSHARALALVTSLALFSCADPIEPPADQRQMELDEPDFIKRLETAYRTRDAPVFASLLADDPENNAEFLFLLVEPTAWGEHQWGFTEEERIHKRMFRPDRLDPGEPEIDPDLWLQEIDVNLTQATPFEERTDLYVSSENPNGLESAKWRASHARYGTFVFFDTVSDTDLLVEGEANFIVIEDLTKAHGDHGKFLLYRWEDLGGTHALTAKRTVSGEETSWGSVKALYSK